jgi:hypothetical protein
METEQEYYFRLRVGEIEVEAAGPEEYVKDVRSYAEQFVAASLTRTKTMGALSPQRETSAQAFTELSGESSLPISKTFDKDESIAEFLERLPSKTHQDKILAFGYFLEKNRGAKSFGVKEINDCYEEVREAKSNTAQYFTLLVKSGLMMKGKSQTAGGPTQYVLTRKGEAAIKGLLGSQDEA